MRLLLAILCALPLCAQQAASRPASRTDTAPSRPNLVLIVADDLGYGELGCYGGAQIPTPHLDALAAGGVRMTQGYVTCPVCAPTRAALLTGRYQQRFGFEFNPGPEARAPADFGLPKTELTLGERFAALGYATGMVGKWHLGYREGLRPTERGFAEFYGFLAGAHPYRANAARSGGNPILQGTTPVDTGAYLTVAFAREARAFIARHAQTPFCLYVPFNAVHAPLQAPPQYLQRFAAISDPKRRTFAAMLAVLDDAVGTIRKELQTHGLLENTLLVFLSDNGGPTPSTTSGNGPLRGTKATVWEGGVRVPFLVHWPARIPGGKVFAAPVSSLDVLPTFLAAEGAPLPEGLDGVDLVPFLRGERTGRPHERLFWRFGEQRAVRVGDWKLLQTRDGEVQLFDLARDPGETTDLSAAAPERVTALERDYEAWNATLLAPRWRRG